MRIPSNKQGIQREKQSEEGEQKNIEQPHTNHSRNPHESLLDHSITVLPLSIQSKHHQPSRNHPTFIPTSQNRFLCISNAPVTPRQKLTFRPQVNSSATTARPNSPISSNPAQGRACSPNSLHVGAQPCKSCHRTFSALAHLKPPKATVQTP